MHCRLYSTFSFAGAMWVARTRLFVPTGGDRPLVPDLTIIITDGVPNREQDSYYQEVFELRVNKCTD